MIGNIFYRVTGLLSGFVLLTAVSAACSQSETAPVTVATEPPTAVATAVPEISLPEIAEVTLDRSELPRYESLEMEIALEAEYDSPYDAREVRLDGLFTGPDGSEMLVPGFWDGDGAWRLRFTPGQTGAWTYQLSVTDARGTSEPVAGQISVTDSEAPGWLLPGNVVNPEYSSRYLAHHDGTPFYGIGHADALNILIDGFDAERGVGLFDDMVEAGENYVVWWPFYNMPVLTSGYDKYAVGNMAVIDTIVKDASENGIYLIFTIWDHPQLRDDTHAWDDGKWQANGFNELSDIDGFFSDAESWAWQENYYRYMIGRWGYSPAIGMWQTVSEIDGTNAYEQTDAWHDRVNAYFLENDPYRHPTTASRSGDVDWPAGHAQMDVPQVHLYDFDDAIGAADVLARWTSQMWERSEKPNWVGEFGVPGNSEYPELYHHAIWAALANGAAMTPAEWNSGDTWMRMSPEMLTDLNHLKAFVSELPLVALDPAPLLIESSDPDVRAWGLAGNDGGLIWAQDFGLAGAEIDVVRANETIRSGVTLTVDGLQAGRYDVTPFDTWQGVYLDVIPLECEDEPPCLLPLPDFKADMAFKISKTN